MDDIKIVFSAFEECFGKYAEQIGFKKARKKHYIRKVGQCIQHINILDTKIKGQQSINIRISVGITYIDVNKKVAELRIKEYDSKWATGSNDLGALSVPPENFSRYLLLDTDVDSLCKEIFSRIESNASRFWDKTDSMDKFLKGLLDDEKEVCSSTSGLWRPSWTSLALACLIEPSKINFVLDKYSDFFARNLPDESRDLLNKQYSLERE